MVGYSNVAESLWQVGCPDEGQGDDPISHSKTSWSLQIYDFKNIESLQHHKLIQVPQEGCLSMKNKYKRGPDTAEDVNGQSFPSCSWNCSQFSAVKGKDLSRHTVSRHLRLWTESPLCSDQTPQ